MSAPPEARLLLRKNFIEAKYNFTQRMLDWGGGACNAKILDVGCGIGGTTRYMANLLPNSTITISPSAQNNKRAAGLGPRAERAQRVHDLEPGVGHVLLSQVRGSFGLFWLRVMPVIVLLGNKLAM